LQDFLLGNKGKSTRLKVVFVVTDPEVLSIEDSWFEEARQRFSIFSVALESTEISSLSSLAVVVSSRSGSKLVSDMDPDESCDD